MENDELDIILEGYIKAYEDKGPEEAEKYLVDAGVDVSDLPKKLADSIAEFLLNRPTLLSAGLSESEDKNK